MKRKFEIYEGKTVWLFPTGNYARYHNVDLEEAVVTKIARKYFYCVRLGWEKFPIKFVLEDFSSVCEDCNAGYDIYESPEMYVQSFEDGKMFSCVGEYFRSFGRKRPSHDTMSKIMNLLYAEGIVTSNYEGFKKVLDDRYEIRTVYANQLENDCYGDIYSFRNEAAIAHPGEEIIFGFCVVDTTTGLIPDGCNDWNDTVEEAVSDFEKYKERKGEEK